MSSFFHIRSIWIVLVLALPNLLFVFLPAHSIALADEPPPWWTLVLISERIGQMSIFLLPLLYPSSIDTRTKLVAVITMMVCASIYYICWGRYFLCGQSAALLYQDLLRIPIPMAIFPILYALAASVLLDSVPMAIGSILLAIGHIPESYRCYLLYK